MTTSLRRFQPLIVVLLGLVVSYLILGIQQFQNFMTLGAVYARRPGVGSSGPRPPRRLLGYTEDSLLAGGRVTLALVPSGKRRTMTGEGWAAWAGEPVEEGS